MAEAATIEPPVSTPDRSEEAKTAVQHAFDKAFESKQAKKIKPAAASPVEALKAPEAPKAAEESKVAVEVSKTPAPAEPEPTKPVEQKLPSFITDPLKKEAEKPVEPEIKIEDLPKELPVTASEDQKINWKKTRTLIERLDAENKSLKEKQSVQQDAGKELSKVDEARLKQLETELSQAKGQLQRYGLEHDPAFVSQVIRPLQANYAKAKQIITDGGGDVSQLDKALALTGKLHYEAMDEILDTLPQSAKQELMATVGNWRHFADMRARNIADAPRVMERLQKEQEEAYKKNIEGQRGEMSALYDQTVKNLRDDLKFELLQKTDDKDAQWWNEIPDKIVEAGKKLFLENQDMGIVAQACVLAPAAITIRDLWLKAEERARNAEKELQEIRGAEPTIKDSVTIPSQDEKPDLKKPFGQVFLDVLHKQTGR